MKRKDGNMEDSSQSDRLSDRLKTLSEEAKALLNLKSEFGRLPNSKVKDFALDTIENWFDTLPSGTWVPQPDNSLELPAVGFVKNPTEPSLAKDQPRDLNSAIEEDDIPF
jgi:hypothetical protein